MRWGLVFACLLLTTPALADVGPGTGTSGTPSISLPADGDDYSKLAAQAATRDNGLDFHALRFAWLTSAARQRHNERTLADMRRQMTDAVKANDPALVRDRAIALLSLEYIDMNAQKLLRQSCTLLRDQPCVDQAHFMEFGLLNSIVHGGGDGKSCATGWDVAMIGEEYFLLGMMGLQHQQQALIQDGSHACDAMTEKDEKGEPRVFYFKIDRVLADEAALLKPKP